MKIRKSPLEGVLIIESTPFRDHRGFFTRLYCENELAAILGNRKIVQINLSSTCLAGALRGLHFQVPPQAEMKLVRCLKGRVWDVVVDLRQSSDTFLQWHAEEITSANNIMVIIPEGCAHGFQVLEPGSELLYLHTNFYNPEYEAGIPYNDPMLNIPWPVAITDISKRDSFHPALKPDFKGIAV